MGLVTTHCACRSGAKNGSAMIERKSFMSLVALFLNAQSCSARREDDAVLFPLRQRHFEEANVRYIIRLRRDSLPLVERLVLLLGSITSSFFIARIVGLPRGSAAPGLERFAEQGAATCADCREQRIAFSERVPQERAASRTDRVANDPRRADAGAAAQSDKRPPLQRELIESSCPHFYGHFTRSLLRPLARYGCVCRVPAKNEPLRVERKQLLALSLSAIEAN